jgi:hypothetical protein
MKISWSSVSVSTSLGKGSVGTPPKLATGHPMTILLFGKRPPRLVDRRKHPKLKKALKKLEATVDQIAEIVGRASNAFSVELCEGENASINRDGQIAVGVGLLEEYQGNDAFLVGLLGHEVGHKPWTWPKGDLSKLTKKQLDALYREEEAKADRFAGKVLAELGVSPDEICAFLLKHETFEGRKPSDYYPADVRAAMIKEAFRRRTNMLKAGAAVFGARNRTRNLR